MQDDLSQDEWENVWRIKQCRTVIQSRRASTEDSASSLAWDSNHQENDHAKSAEISYPVSKALILARLALVLLYTAVLLFTFTNSSHHLITNPDTNLPSASESSRLQPALHYSTRTVKYNFKDINAFAPLQWRLADVQYSKMLSPREASMLLLNKMDKLCLMEKKKDKEALS